MFYKLVFYYLFKILDVIDLQYHMKHDAMLLLSFFETINVASVYLYFDLPYQTYSHKADIFFCAVIFTLLNGFYFMYKSKYLEILLECKAKPIILRNFGMAFTVIYSILSCVTFFILYAK